MPEVAPRGSKSADAFLAAEPGQLGASKLDPDKNASRRWLITVRLAMTSGAEGTGGLEPGSAKIFWPNETLCCGPKPAKSEAGGGEDPRGIMCSPTEIF
jgi:hypothetical protein